MDIVRGSANSEMSVGVGVRSRQSRRRREKKSHTSSRVRIVTRAVDAPLDTRTSPLDCLVVAPPFAARSAASLACFSCASSVSRSFRPRVFVVVRAREKARVDTARAAP